MHLYLVHIFSTGQGQAATGSLVPPPPPPAPPTPTIPLPPPPPGIPLPPPTPKLPADQGDEPVDLSRDLLQKMQHRLRRRIKRKGGEEQTAGAERGVELVGVKTDIKVCSFLLCRVKFFCLGGHFCHDALQCIYYVVANIVKVKPLSKETPQTYHLNPLFQVPFEKGSTFTSLIPMHNRGSSS